MLNYMRSLQNSCFPLPSHQREEREIARIHQELNGRLNRGDRARLQCLMDRIERLRRVTVEDHFTAGFTLGWHLREELQGEGILSTEQTEGGSCGGKATSIR